MMRESSCARLFDIQFLMPFNKINGIINA